MPLVIQSLAPILVVEDIAPSLAFWSDALGFALGPTVPDAPPYDFAIVARDGVEVMLQTRQSATEDTPAAVSGAAGAILYMSVENLDAVLAKLPDAAVVVPRRTTFYGADEVFLGAPGGHVVGFAAFAAPIEA